MTESAKNLIPITDLTLPELQQTMQALGEPAFRVRQMVQWIYQKRIGSFEQLRNIPKAVRDLLAARFTVGKLEIDTLLESRDGDAVKFAFRVPEADWCIESVLLLDGKRRTACLSSQLGCGLGCQFCVTGQLGFVRNLSQAEILGQLIAIDDYLAGHDDQLVSNIVFMGMGEALANFTRFMSAVTIMLHPDAFNLNARRLTVSTAGVVPSIQRLMETGLKLGLAISLNTYSDAKRDVLMPVNRQYPLAQLIAAAKEYARYSEEPVTFEYVVVPGHNDTDEAVAALGRLLRGVNCKINLIPLNPGADASLPQPAPASVDLLADRLHQAGLMVTVRKSKGRDISGACGQLAGRRAKGSRDRADA
jgi:23S rRNA (adenine2503-C2)-methyltransferase